MLMTRDSVKRALRYAVGLRGADFRYEAVVVEGGALQCVYADPNSRCPSCLIGLVLAFHGVDLEAYVKESRSPESVLGDLECIPDQLSFESDHEQRVIAKALCRAQAVQDEGSTWGKARESALEILAQEHTA